MAPRVVIPPPPHHLRRRASGEHDPTPGGDAGKKLKILDRTGRFSYVVTTFLGRSRQPPTRGAMSIPSLQEAISTCRLCPRLVAWREGVAREKRASFAQEEYWGRPVPGFGDPGARLLVVGLAPAAHGANRTGRMFTGDRSGDWLFRALHRAGFANQPDSTDRRDGLLLSDCYITAAVRCAPPDNKPSTEERDICRPFLEMEIDLLDRIRVMVVLGKFAFDQLWRILQGRGEELPRPRVRFGHGVEVRIRPDLTLLASFHPSQQNTFTGKLTEEMFDGVWARVRSLVQS